MAAGVEQGINPPSTGDGGAYGLPAAARQMMDGLQDGIALGIRGIADFGGLFAPWAEKIGAEGYGWLQIAGLALAIGLVGAIAGFAVYRFAAFLLQPQRRRFADSLPGRFRRAGVQLAIDLSGFVAFAVVTGVLAGSVIPQGTLAHDSVQALLNVAITALAYAIFARLLFAPGDAAARLIPIPNAGWHWRMVAAYGAIGGVVGQMVRLAHVSGADAIAIEGWFLAGATVLTLLKLWWFIAGARDIEAAFAGSEPGLFRRAAAALLPYFYVVTALVIWAVGCLAAGKPQSTSWNFAAGTTQVTLLLLPILALGAHALMSAAAAARFRRRQPGALEQAATAAGHTLVTGGIWLIGVYLIVELWKPIMADGAAFAALRLVSGAMRLLAAVVFCWTAWSFLKTWFEAIAPAQRANLPGADQDEGPGAPASRLHTVLPLVRNVVFIAVLAISILVVLSSLGVNTAPLLAGFGVFGLAVSFGSQTLIRDIVSGMFFLADDAFRVGEYVDTGKLKGTVEKISLRSVQLRHQNGPLHTIPFGQMQAITNYSRDWSTIKFELHFDRDADPEQIRKTVKKVGLAMLEDEEIGKEFLVPLKMQGIRDVTDNSLVVRLKFTAKPGNPSFIQREAMKRLLAAFRETGIALASNAVTVRGGEATAAAAAAVRFPSGRSSPSEAPAAHANG